MIDAMILKRELEQKIQALVQEYTDTCDLHIEEIKIYSQLNSRNKRKITRVRAVLDTETMQAAMS